MFLNVKELEEGFEEGAWFNQYLYYNCTYLTFGDEFFCVFN